MQNPKDYHVEIKGIRDGLLVTLGEGDWQELQTIFLAQLEERASFFRGARLALDLGNRVLHAADLGNLRDRLSDKEITLWAVLGNADGTEKAAKDLGLATRLTPAKVEKPVKPLDTNLGGEDAVLVQRTLRSGFKIATRVHVIVLGDVNPGAEIIAGGNVIIWGRLKGTAHAGAEGNREATVCALEMEPMQLRIADLVAISPKHRGKPQPEIARIQGNQVVVDQWNMKENRGGK